MCAAVSVWACVLLLFLVSLFYSLRLAHMCSSFGYMRPLRTTAVRQMLTAFVCHATHTHVCVCVHGPWAGPRSMSQQGVLFVVYVQHRVSCFLSCCAGHPWADRWLYVKGAGAPLPTDCDSWQLSRIKPARPAPCALHTCRPCRMQQAGEQRRSGVVVRVHDPTSVWCSCSPEANAQHGWLCCAVW